MFKSIKRLLTAAMAIVAMSAPTAAYAFIPEAGGGSSTSGQAQSSVAQLRAAAQLRRLGELQASTGQLFASEGGWPTGASSVHLAGPASQGGFPWGDVGIGTAGGLALIGIGAGATLAIRRRVHHPLAS